MFETTLNLGDIKKASRESASWESLCEIRKYLTKVMQLLRQEGLSPAHYLLRGGFRENSDLELLVRTGSDHTGREWPPTNGFAPRSSENSTFAAPVGSIGGSSDTMRDPLWHAVFGKGQVHAMAVYDASRLMMVGGSRDLNEYTFTDPANMKKALLGIVTVTYTIVKPEDKPTRRAIF